MSLQDKAMLATLKIKKWSGKGRDNTARDNLCATENASTEAVTVSKRLVFGDIFESIRALDNQARARFYALTLPWMDDGSRILSAKAYQDVILEFSTLKDEFESMADKVVAAMAQEKADARLRLGGLYKDDDYPTDAEIRGRYSFEFGVMPIPSGADLRVSVGDAERARIAQEIEAKVKAAEFAAKRDVFDRVADCVARMAESLPKFNPEGKGKDRGTFRDTLVTNLSELVGTLDVLNFDDDARLKELGDRCKEKLLAFTPEQLRDDPQARATVAESAEDILAAMAGYTGGVTMPHKQAAA